MQFTSIEIEFNFLRPSKHHCIDINTHDIYVLIFNCTTARFGYALCARSPSSSHSILANYFGTLTQVLFIVNL